MKRMTKLANFCSYSQGVGNQNQSTGAAHWRANRHVSLQENPFDSPKLMRRFRLKTLLISMIAENRQLRGMLKALSAFIASDIGSALSNTGFNKEQFSELTNKHDHDTVQQVCVLFSSGQMLIKAILGPGAMDVYS